jgi:hypothetical protein
MARSRGLGDVYKRQDRGGVAYQAFAEQKQKQQKN